MSRPTPTIYKTSSWPAYTEALKRRGLLTIRWPAGDCPQSPSGWFDAEMNWDAVPNDKRGRQQTSGDAAIQTCLSMKMLFGMALRLTTGFVESLLRLVGLDWEVPDFSTLSRRRKTLAVNIPCLPDMLPVVGSVPGHPGLWCNFGHGHQGFTLGPTSGQVLAAKIFDAASSDPFPELDPARFA